MLYFIFEGNFPRGGGGEGLYLKTRFNGGFFCVTGLRDLYFEGLIHGGAYSRNFTVCSFPEKRGKKSIKMKAHTIRAEFVCLLIEPIFFRCGSHHHWFIISTSLPLFSQDLFELMHVLPQKSKFHYQAPFWKWKGAKFCINEFPRQWGWKEYPLTKSAE